MAEELLPPIDIVQLHGDAAAALAAVKELRAEVAGLKKRVGDLERRQGRGGAVPATGKATGPEAPGSAPADTQRHIPAASEDELYQRGLEAFQARDYQGALRLLTKMTAENPQGARLEDGHYWAGECLYGMKRYGNAADAFETVLRLPGTTRDEEAQMKLGVCLARMGRTREARKAFQTLITRFPSSTHVPRARTYLEKLGL